MALIKSQNPALAADADALAKTVAQFEQLVALDTVRNNYLLRPRVIKFIRESPSRNVDELNKKIYAELFLTPRTDTWLGLAPDSAYSALANDGQSTH